jgi:hypothetical protein
MYRPDPNTASLDWFGFDHTSFDAISFTNGEFRNVFERLDRQFDIVVFDACFLGSMEVRGEIADWTDYVIASPEHFPATGFPWTCILTSWQRNMSPRAVTEHLTRYFKYAYSEGGILNPNEDRPLRVSISAFSMEKHENLINTIRDFAEEFSNPAYSDFFQNIRLNIDQTYIYNRFQIDIDFLLWVRRIRRYNDFEPSQREVVENLYYALNDFIIVNHTLATEHQRNLSIWYLDSLHGFHHLFESQWHNLRFAESYWAMFKNYAFGEDTIPPHPVTTITHSINLETLFINWIAPIDPVPLRYELKIYNEFGEQIFNEILSTNYFSKRITKSGHYYITAIDRAGNRSDTSERQCFTYTPLHRNEFFIAPNPVRREHETFTAVFYLHTPTDIANISIFNISGQLVWQYEKSVDRLGDHRISIPNIFSSGVYFAILETETFCMSSRFAIIR